MVYFGDYVFPKRPFSYTTNILNIFRKKKKKKYIQKNQYEDSTIFTNMYSTLILFFGELQISAVSKTWKYH